MASRKDDKKDEGVNTTNAQQQATAAASASINRAIEETRDSIKRTTEETRREIPKYGEAVTDFQRRTVDTTREMAESFVTGTRIANNMMVASMESTRTTMDYTRDNVRDITRLASNNARAAEEITKGVTRVSYGSSFAPSSRTGLTEERDEGRQRR